MRGFVPIELALHRRHIDDVFILLSSVQNEQPLLPYRAGVAHHHVLQVPIDDERRQRVDGKHFRHLGRLDLLELQHPAIGPSQVQLLRVDVACVDWKQRRVVLTVLG